MPYPGGKAQPGVLHAIINQMPPHQGYVEAFAGGAAILRAKKLAEYSIAIEIDPGQAARLAKEFEPAGVTVVNADVVPWLEKRAWSPNELLYLDPPYLMSTRSTKQRIYAHEFAAEEQHAELLDILTQLPAMVAISGYRSALYCERLAAWRLTTFNAVNRAGKVVREHLWTNYPAPTQLHDNRYLGDGFRDRERIKRMQRRWLAKLARLDTLERRALLAALTELDAARATPEPARVDNAASDTHASRATPHACKPWCGLGRRLCPACRTRTQPSLDGLSLFQGADA